MQSKKNSEIINDDSLGVTKSWKYWKPIVDFVSCIWCGAFLISLVDFFSDSVLLSSNITYLLDMIMIMAIPFFILDLVLKYFTYSKSSFFIKKHWIDILFVIPYLRVLGFLRFFKIISFLKIGNIPKLMKVIINSPKAVRRMIKILKKS